MDAVQDPTNQALVTSIADEACARAKLSFSDSAVASAECEEARVKAGKAAWIEIERAAKDGRQPNLVLDDLMPGLPTARAATAPDALAHATVPTSAQAEPNVQQQPQSQPDPSTKLTDAIIAEHERKHHVSAACSSLAVLGHLIAQERDSGVSIEDTKSRLDDIKGATPKYRAALYSLIDSIYAHPEDSFETVEANITAQCGKSDALTTPQTAGPNTKQQLSKNNKLAAGVWYLLMPPLNSHLNPINEATLPQWYQDFAFDSAKACEATKLATLDQLRRTLYDPTLIAGFAKDRAEHLAEGREALTIGQTYARTQASLCVSADDPRLAK